ncbi:MAG: small multi-drug export protein [Nanoarchaeota archaeon]|nr:small multi-drug export protein [Nanoarchaeota archaeon]
MNNIIEMILITLLPFLELRASIPYGILKLGMGWIVVFAVCVIANIALAPVVYFFLDKVIHIFLRIKVINRIYQHYVEKTQKKIHKYVDKYGEWALALFIAVPLPGSGVYTGMLAAYLLGLGYKKSFYAAVIGVLIAGIIVTLISVTGSEAWFFLIKMNG